MLEESQSAKYTAWKHIRTRILDGSLHGGERLNPQRIADELGLSRMPVREAVQQLQTEGLVTILPNRAAVVTLLGPDEVRELFEIRAVLEGLAVRLAAPALRGPLAEELEDACSRLDRVRADPRKWLQRHDEFHDFICLQSGRPRLHADLRRLRAAVHPYLLLYIDVYHATEMVGFEHGALVDVIVGATDAQIETCMRDHVMSAAAGVLEFLRARAAKQAARIDA